MLRTLKTKFTAVFLIVLIVTILIFSSAIYGLVNSEMYKPEQRMQVGWMMKTHPERFKGIDRIEDDLYEEIRGYIEEEERERFQQLVFLLMIPTILISGALAYATAYYLVKPIEELSDDVEKLGGGDFSKRLPRRDNSEEIEYLRESFNSLLDKVESAFDSQEEFIQDAAHELRTPLSSMKAHLQLIKNNESVSIEEYESAIDVLSRMNEQLVKLSEDLLYLDRRKVINKVKLNPSELIDDVLETINSLALEEGVMISTEFKYKGKIYADPMSLARAFENVIENSIKYGAKEIIIKGDTDNGNLLLTFVDDGQGISNIDLKHIYDRFYRGSSDQVVDGNGLGLSIVKKIVEDHDGSIEIISEVGNGTEVNITLPRDN